MKKSVAFSTVLIAFGVVAFGCSGGPTSTVDRTALSPRAEEFAPVETLVVPTNGSSATSVMTLESGALYKIRASGTFHIGGGGDSTGDAEYADFGEIPTSVIDNCGDSTSGVDLGLGINDAVNDSLKSPKWGPFSADHVYTVDFVGLGAPVTLNYHDCNYEDNVGFLTVEILARTVIPIQVDIKPGSDRNPVNVGSQGVIPVAILGSADFDVHDVDVSSLAFGPLGAPEAHGQGELEDVNDDGYVDLMLHFRTQAVGLHDGDTQLCLTGLNHDGVKLEGCDSIVTVPPQKD
jgi:hypothetical protein